jgi:hypothetical protein
MLGMRPLTTADDVYGTLPHDFIGAECHGIPLGPVLCLAEREARHAVHLAQQGFAVTAVDKSAVGLATAARLADERGVSIAPWPPRSRADGGRQAG